jgi:tRNA A37 threonylcarbamoyladenosine dehydratase
VLEINPSCRVSVNRKFFSAATADEILGKSYSLVIDTIDSVEQKVLLIAQCAARGIRLITIGSAGNRLFPRLATVNDLSKTIHDPLLQIVRKRLRQEHSFPRSERTKFDIPCIYAPLQRGPRTPQVEPCSNGRAAPTERTGGSCNAGLGSAVFVTGTLGFLAASEAIEIISSDLQTSPYPWIEQRRARLSEPV